MQHRLLWGMSAEATAAPALLPQPITTRSNQIQRFHHLHTLNRNLACLRRSGHHRAYLQ